MRGAAIFWALLLASCERSSPSSSAAQTVASDSATPLATATASVAMTPSSSASAAEPEPVAVLALPAGPRAGKKRATLADSHWHEGERVEVDPSFVFELGTGSALDGLAVATVSGDRRLRYVWPSHGAGKLEWRALETEIAESELGDLVRVLNETKFLEQPMRIEDARVHDGAQWIVFVRTRGRDKYVSLSNVFPETILRIGRFVTDLVNRHADAPPRVIQSGGVNDDHLWEEARAYRGEKRDSPPSVWAAISSARLLAPSTLVVGTLKVRSKGLAIATGQSFRPAHGPILVRVQYYPGKVDPAADYDLELSVLEPRHAKKGIAPIPVLTKGRPHAVDAELSD